VANLPTAQEGDILDIFTRDLNRCKIDKNKKGEKLASKRQNMDESKCK
jgi:hypothetical protein